MIRSIRFRETFLGLFLLTLTGQINAQTIDWLSQDQTIPFTDYYRAVTHDSGGASYHTGLEMNGSVSSCPGKILLASYNPSGALAYSTFYQPSVSNGICDEEGSAILYHEASGKLVIGGRENAKAFIGYFDVTTGSFLGKVSINSTGAFSAVKGLYLRGNEIYAVGYFQNSITFGGGTSITLTGSSSYNAFVAKFDMLGNVIQAIDVTSAGYVMGFDIEVNNAITVSYLQEARLILFQVVGIKS